MTAISLEQYVLSNVIKSWQPSAPKQNLAFRAQILKQIRHFFDSKNILEVDTPLLCHTSGTDPYIQSMTVPLDNKTYYLQTSPEYAMKRLLAAGSGPIYQICKAFRQDETGRNHNPEFTMLEWYRPGFTHHDLMNEMDELLQQLCQTPAADRKTYTQLFQEHLQLDPHQATLADCANAANANHLSIAADITDKDTWLNLLMSHCIEPHLGKTSPCFVYDFPASQAALAKIIPSTPPVAARFEVYYKGIELANGFYELQSPQEQRQRFENNLITRKEQGLPILPIDELFLAALAHGLPDCSGVALGVDRLIMLAAGHERLSDILSFDFTRV